MLRVRLALQLGVGDLVGPGPERRRPLDPLEEVAPAAPGAAGERALEHHLGAAAPAPRGSPPRPAPATRPPATISTTPRPAALSRARWRASWASPWRCRSSASSLSSPGAGPPPVIRARSSVVAWAHPAKRMRSEAERRTPHSLLCISPLPSALPTPPERPPAGRVARASSYGLLSVTKPVIVSSSLRRRPNSTASVTERCKRDEHTWNAAACARYRTIRSRRSRHLLCER